MPLNKIVNGVVIILTEDEENAVKAEREKNKKEIAKTAYKFSRRKEYGPLQKQIEFITENGLEAWKTKVAEIKAKHPKTTD